MHPWSTPPPPQPAPAAVPHLSCCPRASSSPRPRRDRQVASPVGFTERPDRSPLWLGRAAPLHPSGHSSPLPPSACKCGWFCRRFSSAVPLLPLRRQSPALDSAMALLSCGPGHQPESHLRRSPLKQGHLTGRCGYFTTRNSWIMCRLLTRFDSLKSTPWIKLGASATSHCQPCSSQATPACFAVDPPGCREVLFPCRLHRRARI